MSQIVVTGDTGLNGSVTISGSKNSALPILAASIMIDETIVLDNVPELRDIFTMLSILQRIGRKVSFSGNTVRIEPGEIVVGNIPYELIGKMRASFNLLGPLAVRCGWAKVGKPGGCNIGQRPVDYHLRGLRKLGFRISEQHGDVLAVSPGSFDDLIHYRLPYPSVGATEQLMTVASLMKGSKVVIENAAREPEVCDLQGFLNGCGADVKGAGTSVIEIVGKEVLHGTDYRVIPDRVEAGTYLFAGLATLGEVTVKSVIPEHLAVPMEIMREIGGVIDVTEDSVHIGASSPLRAVKVSSEPYPGFPTDLQPLLTVTLSTANGESVVEEGVFENRFGYVDELNRMGADVKVCNRKAFIKGVSGLSGAEIKAPDIRATAALIVAGLIAEGETIIHEAAHIFRGYEKIQTKLKDLGAVIKVFPDEDG